MAAEGFFVSESTTLLKVPEAATLLNISRSMLYALLARGEGPPVVRLGRSVRVDRGALQAWIAEQSVSNG